MTNYVHTYVCMYVMEDCELGSMWFLNDSAGICTIPASQKVLIHVFDYGPLRSFDLPASDFFFCAANVKSCI